MDTIIGVVRGNVVVLPESVDLPDGSAVEVRVLTTDYERVDDEAETRFKQRLVELGLLTTIRTPAPIPPEADRTPIQVRGKPLSEIIIEERR